MLILDLFVSQGRLTDLAAKEIESDLTLNDGLILDDILSSKGISDNDIASVRAMLFGASVWKNDVPTSPDLLKYLGTAQCKKMLAAPLAFIDGVISVGVVDPERGQVLDSLQFLFGAEHLPYKLYILPYGLWKQRFGERTISTQSPLASHAPQGTAVSNTQKMADQYVTKPQVSSSATATQAVVMSVEPPQPASTITNPTDNAQSIDSKPQTISQQAKPVRSKSDDSMIDLSNIDPILDKIHSLGVPDIFNLLLRYALAHEASDIHVEHMESDMRVRCRIDGQLNQIVSLPDNIHPMLIARIKILSGMKLDEKRKPQDGRFSTLLDDHQIDYRVSSFPAYYGEKIVIRILDSFRGVRKIDTVGLSKADLVKVREALAAPFGIILISGPTGSGKTTTLYAMLQEIDREHRNVVSLEDPVEYNLPSINQSGVNAEIGYTFASGLRSILRQDPDVIMVGEIRDAETASLAIQAALTGHLVFSTIHTNTATGVITRLLDMGIEPYLIAPTLKLAIGQRLVRRTAAGCSAPMDGDLAELVQKEFEDVPEEFKKDLPLTSPLTKAIASEKFPSGVKGRQPVFEVLVVDNEIEEAIGAKRSEQDIIEMAVKKGMLNLKQDALLKCIQGIVPYAETHEL